MSFVADVVVANDESHIVDFRSRYLRGLVDVHFIGESEVTFSGAKKPLHFTEARARSPEHFFKTEIIVIPARVLDSTTDPFRRGNQQRDFLLNAVSEKIPPDSIIFFGDVDEVPSRQQITLAVENLVVGEIRSVPMHYSYRRANWLKDGDPSNWSFGKLARGIRPGSDLRWRDYVACDGPPGIHLSYVGFSPELVRSKLESFDHTEYSAPHMSTPGLLSFADDFSIDHLARIGEGFGLLTCVEPGSLGDFGELIVEDYPAWLGSRPQFSRMQRAVASVFLNRYRRFGDEKHLQTAYESWQSPRWVFGLILLAAHVASNYFQSRFSWRGR